jgi:hypothetical protein
MRHARSLACFCFLPLILLVLAAPARADFTPTSAFTDHGDGTVTHTVTGLMWQRCSMGQAWNGSGCSGEAGEYTFEQAQGLTSSLGGHADWRLPSLWELMTIVDYDESNPAINGEVFPDTLSSLFWSGSPFANLSEVAWYVHFRHGNANGSSRDDARSVRLVRGAQSFDPFAQPTSDYRDNGDGTVTHLRTGLMWQRCAVGQNWSGGRCSGTATDHTYDEAEALTSTLGGHADWRLPDVVELASIIDYSASNPAINGDVFPNTPSSGFWSGSPDANLSDYAWGVYFNYGNAFSAYRDDARSVRLLRGGQSFDLSGTASPAAPTLTLTSAPTSGEAPLTVALGASVSGGGTPPFTFAWDLDDGATASGQNPLHTYATPGSYQATATVTDANGATASATTTITVRERPNAEAMVRAGLNRSSYSVGDQLLFSLTLNGSSEVDLYAAMIFPQGYFITFGYPMTVSSPDNIIPYQESIGLTGEQSFSVLDLPLPPTANGPYLACGVITPAGSDPWATEQWIGMSCEGFDVR